MDLVIKVDGSWWHEGAPIARPALIRLFSRVLRKDDDGHVLVTPAEKLSITVEDAPFLAVDAIEEGENLVFLTNVGDRVTLSDEHPVMMKTSPALGQRAPYIRVRGGLEARFDRPLYYRLMTELPEDDGALVLQSGGATFRLPVETS